MIIEYDGTTYDYDEEAVTVKQALLIEEHIGGTLMDYDNGLTSGRTACYQALGWLLFHGGVVDADGKPETALSSVDFPVLKLAAPYLAARMKKISEIKAEIEAKAGPTGPPGAGEQAQAASPAASGNTSASSPKSSGSARGKSTS